jgi:hypothetical protein
MTIKENLRKKGSVFPYDATFNGGRDAFLTVIEAPRR